MSFVQKVFEQKLWHHIYWEMFRHFLFQKMLCVVLNFAAIWESLSVFLNNSQVLFSWLLHAAFSLRLVVSLVVTVIALNLNKIFASKSRVLPLDWRNVKVLLFGRLTNKLSMFGIFCTRLNSTRNHHSIVMVMGHFVNTPFPRKTDLLMWKETARSQS